MSVFLKNQFFSTPTLPGPQMSEGEPEGPTRDKIGEQPVHFEELHLLNSLLSETAVESLVAQKVHEQVALVIGFPQALGLKVSALFFFSVLSTVSSEHPPFLCDQISVFSSFLVLF